jgi:hypothetical protein
MQPILIRALAHSCQSVFCVYISAGFQGDAFLLIKLMLPGEAKRVYNMTDKRIVKLFSVIFGIKMEAMTKDLEDGNDVAATINAFFDINQNIPPRKKSVLSIQEVGHFRLKGAPIIFIPAY